MGNSYKCVDGFLYVRWECLINVSMDFGMLDGKVLKMFQWILEV